MATRELSKAPHQIRRRIRRKSSTMDKDIELYQREVWGKKSIEEWDLEELAHGRPRNKQGNFMGRAPAWINISVVQEARKRLLQHTFGDLAGKADKAVDVLIKLIESDEVDDRGKPIVDARTRLQACIFIIEQIIGKPSSTVAVTEANPVQTAVAAAIVLDDGEPQDKMRVIDGEVTGVENDNDDQ